MNLQGLRLAVLSEVVKILTKRKRWMHSELLEELVSEKLMVNVSARTIRRAITALRRGGVVVAEGIDGYKITTSIFLLDQTIDDYNGRIRGLVISRDALYKTRRLLVMAKKVRDAKRKRK